MPGTVVSMAGPHVSAPIDANGNLTSDGAKTYFWNALNQLVEVKEGTTTLETFEYDGDGRRTEKASGGVTHTYIYDVEDIIEERISGGSSDTIRYYHGAGIDEPQARKNSSDIVTYYLADHLGSVVQETSASGTVALEREYDPWGALTESATMSGYAFTGREWDAEVGLHYYRGRYYDSQSARFVSQDPIGFASDPNFYAYVANRPLNSIDPTGLTRRDIDQLTEIVRMTQRDLNVPASIGTMPMVDGADGLTNPITRGIWVNNRYLGELTQRERQQLVETIIHETLHRNRPPWDMIRHPFTHDDIYREARRRRLEIDRIMCY
jgi:RHS repeat-associated protein